jgi:diadenylate cyclase
VDDLLYILSRLDFTGIIDILLVALVFYWLLTLIQGTQAVQLLRGIFILSVLAAIAASAFNRLTAFSWLIDKALPALLVAIPVIFQPELRRALEKLGRTDRIFSGSHYPATGLEKAIEAVSKAAVVMSERRHGALIVFERNTSLESYLETGVRLEALATANLIITIFFPGTSLHDGAVIVRNAKLIAAAVVLPLGDSNAAHKHLLGTRHRAALGITEISDAVVVVVSEETGIISVAHNGQLIRGLDRKRLEQVLKAFYRSQLEATIPIWLQVYKNLARRLRSTKSAKPIAQAPGQKQ